MEVVLATRNVDKINEIKDILKDLRLKTLTFRDFSNFPYVKEEGDTLKENALLKAKSISHFTKKIALADDSGLEVEALKGAPGVFSARFAGPGATYKDNNRKLLFSLKGVPDEKRKALFRCVVALIDPQGKEDVVEGICKGEIISEMRGKAGFGYDPLFQPEGFNRTFAELSSKEKNQISHRAKALFKAKMILKERVSSNSSLVIGLTGNIGCGKSVTADIFEEMGAHVIEADRVGHLILEREEVKEELVKLFGESILGKGGKISRKKLRKMVFKNESKLKKLNSILHPLIEQVVKEKIKSSPKKVVVVEAALIFEAGWETIMDKIVVVNCSKDKQKKRIIKGTSLTKNELEFVMRAQLPSSEKAFKADFVLENDGDLIQLKKNAERLWAKLTKNKK